MTLKKKQKKNYIIIIRFYILTFAPKKSNYPQDYLQAMGKEIPQGLTGLIIAVSFEMFLEKQSHS